MLPVGADHDGSTRLDVFREQTVRQIDNRPQNAITPFKLGHVAFNVVGVQKITDFYCEVLGFRVSDWFADFFSFLRCGPDHHTINLLDSQRVKLNHMAFELRDWSHLQSACDYLSKNGYPLIWGPGRHGPGHNLFAYHKNPDGHIVELATLGPGFTVDEEPVELGQSLKLPPWLEGQRADIERLLRPIIVSPWQLPEVV